FDLQVDLAPGQLGDVRRGYQRCVPLAEGDDLGAVRDGDPVPVGVDDAERAHASSPSTRITLITSCTTGSRSMSRTVPCSAESAAACVTMTRLAVSSASRCRTAADRKSTRLNSSHVKISYAVF